MDISDFVLQNKFRNNANQMRSPTILLAISSFLSIFFIILCVNLLVNSATLGIKIGGWDDNSGLFIYSHDGKIIRSFDEIDIKDGNTQKETIVRVQSERGIHHVNNFTSISDPDVLSTFTSFNQFIDEQDALWNVINGRHVVITTNQSEYQLEREIFTSFEIIPTQFWMVSIMGVLGFLIGVSIWATRPTEIPARILAISGIGFFLTALSLSTYTSRELAIDPASFETLVLINHLGIYLFIFSIAFFFWYYPREVRPWPAFSAAYFLAILVWMNEYFQFISWPIHAFYFPLLFSFCLFILLVITQWKLTNKHPIFRACLLWIFLAFFISFSLSLGLYYVPVIFDETPYISVGDIIGLTLIVYFGLSIAVLKYKLFAIRRIWIAIWVWVFSGLVILCVDLLLISLLHLETNFSLAVSVILVGWVYFPIRQFVVGLMYGREENELESFVPLIINSVFDKQRSKDSCEKRICSLFRSIFQAASMEIVEQGSHAPKILNNGLSLIIPALSSERSYILNNRKMGTQLFSMSDINLINSIMPLINATTQLNEEKNEAELRERKRIMRDLHDDVGAKLLMLIHQDNINRVQVLAKNAFNSLRNTIYTLDDSRIFSIDNILSEIEVNLSQRLNENNIQYEFVYSNIPQEINCNSRERYNLACIFDELITNTVKHSLANEIHISCLYKENRLSITIEQNSLELLPKEWVLGKGINNIKTRLAEMNGNISWEVKHREVQGSADLMQLSTQIVINC